MPNYVTNIIEARPEVIARFLVPLSDEDRTAIIAEAQRIFDVRARGHQEFVELGREAYTAKHGSYLTEHVEPWYDEAKSALVVLTTPEIEPAAPKAIEA